MALTQVKALGVSADAIDETKIAERINNNVDLFDRKINYKKVELDKSFPEYIFNNKD